VAAWGRGQSRGLRRWHDRTPRSRRGTWSASPQRPVRRRPRGGRDGGQGKFLSVRQPDRSSRGRWTSPAWSVSSANRSLVLPAGGAEEACSEQSPNLAGTGSSSPSSSSGESVANLTSSPLSTQVDPRRLRLSGVERPELLPSVENLGLPPGCAGCLVGRDAGYLEPEGRVAMRARPE
jgi:hypothetical protein